jgi:hypothetical protein
MAAAGDGTADDLLDVGDDLEGADTKARSTSTSGCWR